MIKKLIALALIVAVIFGVWYFILSPGKDTCTVMMKTGEQETMSVRDLRKIYSKDAYNWSHYSGCEVSGEGTITEVESGYEDFRIEPDFNTVYYTVSIGNGIKFLVTGDQMNGFATGDKVSYTGVLASGNGKLHIYIVGTEEETAMIRLN